MLQTPKDIKFVVVPLVISLIFEGVLALIQFRFFGFKIGVIDSVQSWMVWRSRGTLFHANGFGMYLLLIIPIVFRLTLMAFRSKKRRKGQFYLFVFLLGTAALFTTQNRGSWIGFTFAMITMFIIELYRNRTKMRKILSRLIIPMGIFLLLFIIRYGSFFLNRLIRDDASLQVEERSRMQKDALKVIQKYPVFGVGIMNYIHHNPAGFVHNLYLLITAELGTWGMFCYLWFFFVLYLQTRKADKSSNIYVKNMSMGIETAILGFMVSSLSSPDYLKTFQVGMHVWILAALIAGMNRLSDRYSLQYIEDYFAKKKNVDEDKKQHAIVQVKKIWTSII
jgi:O-antigen ligase